MGKVLDNKKCMLVYGMGDSDFRLLKDIVIKNNLPGCVRRIEKYMASMTVKQIIDGFKIEVADEDIPSDEVILFNNFEDAELEHSIRAIKKSSLKDVIMAVVTPNSLNWTFKKLLSNLILEKEWYKNYRGGNCDEQNR